jgi:hypothetical protein
VAGASAKLRAAFSFMAILLAGTGGDVGQFALQNVATGYCNRMTAAQPGEIAAEGNAHRVLTARDS